VKVKNSLGLHARPATMIAKLLQGTHSSVSFTYKKETINAKSIMSILVLAVSQHGQLLVTVDGLDAELVLRKLLDLFESQFGESDS